MGPPYIAKRPEVTALMLVTAQPRPLLTRVLYPSGRLSVIPVRPLRVFPPHLAQAHLHCAFVHARLRSHYQACLYSDSCSYFRRSNHSLASARPQHPPPPPPPGREPSPQFRHEQLSPSSVPIFPVSRAPRRRRCPRHVPCAVAVSSAPPLDTSSSYPLCMECDRDHPLASPGVL